MVVRSLARLGSYRRVVRPDVEGSGRSLSARLASTRFLGGADMVTAPRLRIRVPSPHESLSRVGINVPSWTLTGASFERSDVSVSGEQNKSGPPHDGLSLVPRAGMSAAVVSAVTMSIGRPGSDTHRAPTAGTGAPLVRS